MKNKKAIFKFLVTGGLLLLVVLAFSKDYTKASNEIEMSIAIPRATYKLGEVIPSSIEIVNKTSRVVYLPHNAFEGPLIQISTENDRNYKYYVGQSRSVTVDGVLPDIEIGSKASFIIPKTILWNYKPDGSHLNSDAAKPLLEGRVLTDYAFTRAGTYFVKAVLMILKEGKSIRIESEPIQITIDEPVGDDFEVWNIIKDNGAFAHFLQEGDLTRGYHKPEEREKFLKEIDQIITRYPKGHYAESLRQSLDKFRASEAMRQEFVRKMEKQKQP